MDRIKILSISCRRFVLSGSERWLAVRLKKALGQFLGLSWVWRVVGASLEANY